MKEDAVSLYWKIASQFQKWPELKYYSFCKLLSDPAYRRLGEKLKGASLPLLDVGCGIGLLGHYLHAKGHEFSVHGIDIDERKIQRGEEVLNDDGLMLEIGSATNMPDFLGNVAVLDVVHYFDDETQRKMLGDIADRVAPGGRALIRIALRDNSLRYMMTVLEDVFTRVVGWIPGGHINFPTLEEIKKPFEERGFHVDVEPLWGLTPFNSYLFDCRRPAN